MGHANKNLVNLRVVGPSIAFKYPAIESCPGLESIEISYPNLVSFSYCGIAINMLLSTVPFLVEVSISKEPVKNSNDHRYRLWGIHYSVSHRSIVLPFTQLSSCLSQLEIHEVDMVGTVSIFNYDLLVFFSSCWITWFLTPCLAFSTTMTTTHFLY